MPRSRVCSVAGCPTVYEGTGSRCPSHTRESDRRRGTAHDRGYTSRGHQAFRSAVLDRDPICVVCHAAESTVADHYPRDRRQLEALNLNPNDPRHGRGLCVPCHGRETAAAQPGGWNAR